MVNLTISVPEELKRRMEGFVEMNWSGVARQAFEEKITDLEFIKKFKSKSSLTQEDAIKLGRELNKALAKRRK